MIRKMLIIFLIALIIPKTCCLGANETKRVKLPVLMYHQISENENSWNNYVISPEEFRSDMEYINSLGWETVGLSELLMWQRGEFIMPEKPVMITFDDGFKSLTKFAEPILEEFGYKAVAAVVGSLCEKYSSGNEYPTEWDYLNWDDVREISQRGTIELQCHSWNMHSKKNNIGCGKRWGENVSEYRRRLSEDLSKFITEFEKRDIEFYYSIAYPYGAFDVNTIEVIKDMGFSAAFTCTEEINILTGDDEELYYLGRYNRPHGITSKNYFENIKKSVDID